MSLFVLAVFELSAILLVYSCFCRAAHTNTRNTRRDVRWAFALLGVMGSLCLFAPLLGDYQPDGLTAALLGAMALIQLVSAYHWRRGVPPAFRKDPP